MKLGILTVALLAVGCASAPPTVAPPGKDPLAGLTPTQQIEALRSNQRMNSMERESKIAEIKKANGIR
ncbi:hypothetical protein OP10G_1354 [Fimbriimonas ginsengisoli Gsoil 348]|uniref:Lipoprotein n=1 Tax=Fimbriimonas ginsengisoli Gsoil 348 TaxID=661478 RepID=A0A068NMU6_FIMGI|nr:hypothetical protein OP10G_1354 [Fimbriimonas ginsengisoli Gsoil 348]